MNITDVESSFKSFNYTKNSENRRKSFLAKQKQARDKNRTNHRIDTLIKEEEEPLQYEMTIDTSDSIISTVQSTSQPDRKKHRLYVKPVLSIPEWMIEPINFSDKSGNDSSNSWYVKVRPEGTHILLQTSRPTCHSSTGKRGKNTVLITIKSPNNTIITKFIYEGSNTKYFPPDTILDCVYDINTNTYYILDVLQWNGYDVTDTTGEFRLSFWLHNKLIEHGFTDTIHILDHGKGTVNESMNTTTTCTDPDGNMDIPTLRVIAIYLQTHVNRAVILLLSRHRSLSMCHIMSVLMIILLHYTSHPFPLPTSLPPPLPLQALLLHHQRVIQMAGYSTIKPDTITVV